MISSIIPMMHLLASLLDESRHACKNFMRSSNDRCLSEIHRKGHHHGKPSSRSNWARSEQMCGVRLQLRHTTAARRLLKNAAEAQDR